MKKTVIVIILLAVLASVAYYVIRSFAPGDPTRYLPANTLAYATLSDLPRTANRWKETELAKIGAEPAVQDFLKLPLEKLGQMGKNEADAILSDLKPVRMFWAVTALQQSNLSWTAGFQYYGSSAALQRALQRLRTQLDNALPPQEKTVTQYEGVEITKSVHGKLTLFSAAKDRWAFLSNTETALHDMLDRYSGRNTTPSLFSNADYQKGLAQLPKESDMSGYVEIQSLLNVLLDVGKSMGATPNPQQLDYVRKAKSISASFKIDGPVMRDSLYIQTGEDITPAKLDHKTVRYTSPETLIYYTTVAKWPNIRDYATTPLIPPDLLQILKDKQLDTTNLSDVLGPEFGLILSWPQGSFRPELLVAVPLKNPATAKNLIETVSASLFPQMAVKEDAGARYYSYPSVQNPLLNPTVAITQDFLLFGFGEKEVRDAATKSGTASTVENAPDFIAIKSLYQDANEAFGYLDSKLVFERSYNALKPIVSFGAAMMPGVSQYLDVSKLPETTLISNHLTPIVFYQRQIPGGIYFESSGPITLPQLFLISGGTGWAFMPAKH